MCATDSRTAEDHGIALYYSDGSSDTRLPLNVGDRDLSPNMQQLPVEKAKWSEMTYSLTMIETSHALQQLYRIPANSFDTAQSESSGDQILKWSKDTSRRQILEEL